MELPKYNPNLWVAFTTGSGAFFGRIKGGSYMKSSWYYEVQGGNGKSFMVPEKDIIATCEQDWSPTNELS